MSRLGGVRDVRYALRGLRLNRLFSAGLVLTLSLGIGASVVMFTVVDALLLRPAPYADPERLVTANTVTSDGEARPYVDWELAETWRRESGVFADALSHAHVSTLYTGGAAPRMLTGESVTANFEELLGVRPSIGRGFHAEDAAPRAPGVILLSHLIWKSAFGGDPSVLGRTMELDGEPYRVVGVMPEGFRFPLYAGQDFWVPIRSDGTVMGEPIRNPGLVGRVGSEPLERVQARLDARAAALAEAWPRDGGWALRIRTLNAARVENPPLRRAVWFLAGAVALLLLMAIVNSTGLLLLRGWARGRETAVRVALGASSGRLVSRILTESFVLAVLSAAGATLLAALIVRALRGILPEAITFFAWYPIEIEARALTLAFVVAAGAGLLIALAPAVATLRPPAVRATAGLTPYSGPTGRRTRMRRVLVVAQVTLSVLLLSGAGLMTNSFLRLASADPGFRIDNLAVLRFFLSSRYDTPVARATFVREVEKRLEAIPGVEGVVINGSVPPVGGFHFDLALEAEGQAPRGDGAPSILPVAWVPTDFFEIMEVQVIAGRRFTASDAGSDAVMIDQGLARFLWPGTSPLGRRFRFGPDRAWMTVVGMVEDLRMTGPDDRDGSYEVLLPASPDEIEPWIPLAIRTRGDPTPLFDEFRAVVRELDPEQPIDELKTARELYASTFQGQRFLMLLMSVLSGLALVLLATMGAALGVVAALSLSDLVRGLLYGVEPDDAPTLATGVALSLGSALLACWWPARRAVRTDPVEVLRAE